MFLNRKIKRFISSFKLFTIQELIYMSVCQVLYNINHLCNVEWILAVSYNYFVMIRFIMALSFSAADK